MKNYLFLCKELHGIVHTFAIEYDFLYGFAHHKGIVVLPDFPSDGHSGCAGLKDVLGFLEDSLSGILSPPAMTTFVLPLLL
jgi:hypothetical protein